MSYTTNRSSKSKTKNSNMKLNKVFLKQECKTKTKIKDWKPSYNKLLPTKPEFLVHCQYTAPSYTYRDYIDSFRLSHFQLVTFCSTVIYILLYSQSHNCVKSHNTVQSVTYWCAVRHIMLYSQSYIAVQSVTYCCTVSHILVYSQSYIGVQSVTYCCTVSHILLYSQSHISVQWDT